MSFLLYVLFVAFLRLVYFCGWYGLHTVKKMFPVLIPPQ